MKPICKQFSVISLLFLTCLPASGAEPDIQNITGKAQTGQILTLFGSHFGDAEITPLLYDIGNNIEEHHHLTPGTILSSDNSIWGGISGTNWGRTPPVIVKEGDLRYKNGSSAYEGAVSFLGLPKPLASINADSLYVSWHFKPYNTIDPGASNKYIRIWDRLDGLGTRISWTTMHLTYEAREIDYTPSPSWSDTVPRQGEWNHFELYVDASAKSIKAYLNGKLQHEVTDFLKSSETEGLKVALIGFDPRDNQKYVDSKFRMKDIYISKTQARVEISNSPEWDPLSRRELADPIEWSDGMISFKLPAAAVDLSQQYIYVIDSKGNVNKEGYPLCDKCPSPVSPLTVN